MTVEGISEKLGLEFKKEIPALSRKSQLIDQSSDLLDKSALFDELDRVAIEPEVKIGAADSSSSKEPAR